MSVAHPGLMARRIAAGFVDFSLEIGSGLLGSYFGAMLAALVVAMRDETPQAMQTSIWNGFGFGFVFWALSISFLNRVLIQGVSRASIGKKLFNLELISCDQPITWGVMVKRWVLGILSSVGGLGYSVMFFNRDGRTAHDLLTATDVVPIFEGRNMSVEHDEKAFVGSQAASPTFSEQFASRVIFMANSHAERPTTAPVIQLPFKRRSTDQVSASAETGPLNVAPAWITAMASEVTAGTASVSSVASTVTSISPAMNSSTSSLADVLEFKPKKEPEKDAAADASTEDEKKVA